MPTAIVALNFPSFVGYFGFEEKNSGAHTEYYNLPIIFASVYIISQPIFFKIHYNLHGF